MSPSYYSRDDSDASSHRSSNRGRVEKYSDRGINSYNVLPRWDPELEASILDAAARNPSLTLSEYKKTIAKIDDDGLEHTNDDNCPICRRDYERWYRREHKSKRGSRSHRERRHSSAAEDLYSPDGPYFPQPHYGGTSTCMTSMSSRVPGGKMKMTSMHAEDASGHTTQTRTWFEPDHHRPDIHGLPVHGVPFPPASLGPPMSPHLGRPHRGVPVPIPPFDTVSPIPPFDTVSPIPPFDTSPQNPRYYVVGPYY
ncbi:hypothetical protein FA95DRAFT_1607231 [Auriscalpium vulgare]|uniref:Uncharacterized protein n=1 Tax=Auriscalpium vulgare TaxID=40419 RepID=A0ACB8RPH2_9AGAM|nr:hypothetical protein FA95DRAFT_1607231 [Auriscalpium vulgare]